MRQGEAKGSGDGYRMKSAPTDGNMPLTIALPRDLSHPGFPRYGNFYAEFSTLWKIFFHSMENMGASARARRGCYERQAPIPAPTCMAFFGEQGPPPYGAQVAASTRFCYDQPSRGLPLLCMCAVR